MPGLNLNLGSKKTIDLKDLLGTAQNKPKKNRKEIL